MKYRHIITLLCVSTPICVLLRAIQLIFTIDDSTGFIKQQYYQVSIMISFVVCAAALAIGVLASTTEDVVKSDKPFQPFIAIAGLLTGGMFVYESVTSISILGFSNWNGALFVLSLLSAGVFIAYGIKNVYEYKFSALMLIIPTIYYVTKLINLFVSTSALSLIVENVFLLFTNSALLLFLFEFSCFESGFKTNAAALKRLLTIGTIAIVLSFSTAIPKMIANISQNNQLSKGDISSALLIIAQAIFIFAYMNGKFYKKNQAMPKSVSKHSA